MDRYRANTGRDMTDLRAARPRGHGRWGRVRRHVKREEFEVCILTQSGPTQSMAHWWNLGGEMDRGVLYRDNYAGQYLRLERRPAQDGQSCCQPPT